MQLNRQSVSYIIGAIIALGLVVFVSVQYMKKSVIYIPINNNDNINQNSGACAPAGCSGQLCVDADKASDIVTTCEFRQEYACYQSAACERQSDGKCGWTETADLNTCLTNAKSLPPTIQ